MPHRSKTEDLQQSGRRDLLVGRLFGCFDSEEGRRGKRGFRWDALIASGIDNNRQHFNGTSFDVAGLLYIIPYQVRPGSTM